MLRSARCPSEAPPNGHPPALEAHGDELDDVPLIVDHQHPGTPVFHAHHTTTESDVGTTTGGARVAQSADLQRCVLGSVRETDKPCNRIRRLGPSASPVKDSFRRRCNMRSWSVPTAHGAPIRSRDEGNRVPTNCCPRVIKGKEPPEIRGAGCVVAALDAELRAFHGSYSFEEGVLSVAQTTS